MSFLKNLPYPDVIEQLSYNELLGGIKSIFKKYLKTEDVVLLESDSYSALLETLAYRELLLRARINSSVKAMLLPYSTGSDLDNVVAIYGIERLKGAKPLASIKFKLSLERDTDVFLPKGLVLLSGDGGRALLKGDLTIPAGELEVDGAIELQEYTKTSDIKCEYIQTPLPFLLKAKQTGKFAGGADKETDENLRNRALLSLQRFSTAGAKGSYKYHSYSANAKVEDVSVKNGGAGVVNVFIKSSDMSEEVLADVRAFLNHEKVRPLTDTVKVSNARTIKTNVKATIELFDLSAQGVIDEIIKNSIKKSFNIGEDLNMSYLYRCLHQAGVYRANLTVPNSDILANDEEFIKIDNINITYKKAAI